MNNKQFGYRERLTALDPILGHQPTFLFLPAPPSPKPVIHALSGPDMWLSSPGGQGGVLFTCSTALWGRWAEGLGGAGCETVSLRAEKGDKGNKNPSCWMAACHIWSAWCNGDVILVGSACGRPGERARLPFFLDVATAEKRCNCALVWLIAHVQVEKWHRIGEGSQHWVKFITATNCTLLTCALA